MDEPLGQSLRRVQRGDLCPERVEGRTLGIGNQGRGLGEHLAGGRDLRRRQPVGEVMPGTARPHDRPITTARLTGRRRQLEDPRRRADLQVKGALAAWMAGGEGDPVDVGTPGRG